MRYFYDTEFIDDGRTIELISIGIAAEDGRDDGEDDHGSLSTPFAMRPTSAKTARVREM